MENKMESSSHPLNVDLLTSTFNALAPQADILVTKFYDKLFIDYPSVRTLFPDNIDAQKNKLITALSTVINSLNDMEGLTNLLAGLGVKHQQYGATKEHYQAVAKTLLSVMAEMAGDLWTDEVDKAWSDALTLIASVMLGAYETQEQENTTMSSPSQSEAANTSGDSSNEMQAAIENISTAIMMIDRDLNVTFVNHATMSLLQKHEETLRTLFPGFSVDNIMGVCIDSFHKNPDHQRRLLSNPANFPYNTDIDLGPLKINLNITAIMDSNGNYTGNTLEWEDVTEQRHRESEVMRLQSSVDNAMTSIMMIDRDLNVTYANDSTIQLLTNYQKELAEVYPGFDASKIVGTCIDVFHANPAHQRKVLDNPANLPYSTDIQVGPLKFRINVSAIMDAQGNYTGCNLEWSDVTEQRKKEDEVMRLQSTVDNAMTAIMQIDRDLNITYANDATIQILRENEIELAQVYPGFSADKIIGSCIDMFHVNPAHQRKMLDNPANLPFSTDIVVGPLTFRINVTAIMDSAGEYIGNALEWSDVTEQRKKELEVTRLQSAVDGAQANLMLCNTDLEITYVNPAVVNMLRLRETELRQAFPGFDANNLIGTCIDIFHKNPAHQRALLADISKLPAKAEIKVADLEFEVNATAVVDKDGQWMGNMVEWRDITEQKAAERQIQSLIDAASSGNLDQRLNADDFSDFLAMLANGINQMLDAVVAPVKEGTRVIKLLAEGDLRENMNGEFEGEFGVMRDAVDTSINNLRKMVTEIRSSSSAIASGASEIAQGNTDLSQRTEEQASSLEETASSMEELTSTVKQNADNAEQANQLASGAREQAEKGGEVVSKAVTAMSEINDSSKKIADIIGVIDEIAFQTNLLALNAAVEAARAGEQGRGFAVVAGEVRNLAQRSAGAAKEIKTLIKDSVIKVDEGSRLVDESGKTLGDIVEAVKKVSDIIAEIAAASQEQSAGIDQVNKAITQMDEVTQQNAALVEEAAAASESMDEQAKNLISQMEFFSTNDQGAPQAQSNVNVSTQAPPARQQASASAPRSASKGSSSPSSDDWEDF